MKSNFPFGAISSNLCPKERLKIKSKDKYLLNHMKNESNDL